MLRKSSKFKLKLSFLATQGIAILIIVFVGALLRLINIGEVPPGPYLDEVLHGLDAYSILKTGKDIYGHTLPLTFQSVSYNPPVYPYLLVPMVAVFGLSAWVIRLPTAISGVLTILFTYLIVSKFVKKEDNLVAMISALLVALSPWHIHLTRVAFIASFGMIFPLVGIYLFLISKKKHFCLILSSIFFAVGTQVHYDGYKLISPIIFISLCALNWRFIKEVVSKKIIAGVLLVWIFAALINFLGYHYYNAGFRSTALTGTTPGQMVVEYLKTYSPNFLFLKGDIDPMRNPWGKGELPLILSPLLILGFLMLNRISKEGRTILLTWFFIAPIPSAIAGYGDHALRNSLMLIPLSILVALGFKWIFEKSKKLIIFKILLIAICLIFALDTINKLEFYWNEYSEKYWSLWGGSLREAASFVESRKNGYDQIYLMDSYNSLLAFYAFGNSNIKAQDIQHAILMPQKFHSFPVKKIDNLYFVPLEEEKSDNWYLEVPKKSLIVDTYFYLKDEQFVSVESHGQKTFQFLEVN
jgi:4-amino-4-deoxy-L-arabinose transferase-like glycosyltransferase